MCYKVSRFRGVKIDKYLRRGEKMENQFSYLQESIPNIKEPEPSFENDVPICHGHI
jgi:hypothetical protein